MTDMESGHQCQKTEYTRSLPRLGAECFLIRRDRYRLSQAGESWPWGRQATGLCISSVIPLLIVIFVLCVVYLSL